MYTFFQPRISVDQEEADIKEMIDEEYERKEQENRDYYKQIFWSGDPEDKFSHQLAIPENDGKEYLEDIERLM